jgi:hypothetical protein
VAGADRDGSGHPAPADAGTVSWRVGSGLHFERRITAIEGNRITLDVPLTNALEREFTDATVTRFTFSQRTLRIGIERMTSRADFDPNSDLGDGMFIEMNGVANAWVREVQTDSYESGLISLGGDQQVGDRRRRRLPGRAQRAGLEPRLRAGRTAEPARARPLGRRSPRPGHAVALGGPQRGARADRGEPLARADPEPLDLRPAAGQRPPARSAASPSGEITMRMRNGGPWRGWAGANCVVWNSEAGRLSIDNPPTAQNWVIGSAAARPSAAAATTPATSPRPESLYRAQLAERLGDGALSALARCDRTRRWPFSGGLRSADHRRRLHPSS